MSLHRRIIRSVVHRAISLGNDRECPFCRWEGYIFSPRRDPRKPSVDAFCPRCRSAERHRLAYMALKDRFKHVDSALHFAPEPHIAKWIKQIAAAYLSCDLEPVAMEVQDITKLTYADERFDFIMCSNVLEHVPDDRKALSELYRVLRRDGTCVLAVPIWRMGDSFEDHSITSPSDRREKFGQADHVRLYGLEDFKRRICEAGFAIEIITPRSFDPRVVTRFGLNHLTTGELFLCTKPAA